MVPLHEGAVVAASTAVAGDATMPSDTDGPEMTGPVVGDLATVAVVLDSTARCDDVERLFARERHVGSVILVQPDGCPLLVDRVSFLNVMLGEAGYGRALYHDKPAERVVDASATLVVPACATVESVYESLLRRPMEHRFRDVIVQYPGARFGTLPAGVLVEQVAAIRAAEALCDPLTGIANRNHLLQEIALELVATQYCQPIGLLFIDLDRFKLVNDALGHSAGDALLRIVAERLRSCVDPSHLLARFGGDEFSVLIRPASDDLYEQAVDYAKRIALALSTPLHIGGHEVFVSASIGIAFALPGESPSELVRHSDIAMYRAKRLGSGYEIFDAHDDTGASQRLVIEAWLRHALAVDALDIYFQPIVALRSGTVSGFEALVRGHHQTLGLLMPSQFLSIAEEIGLLPALDRHVLHGALRAHADWYEQTGQRPFVSVNLSAASLRDDSLLRDIPNALHEYGVPPTALILEITESSMLQDPDHAARLLGNLRQLGVRIAIDDFGTGYSSLTQLTRLHADVLKIDRAFVSRLRESAQDRAIVALVLSLARATQSCAIAEGIEDAEQADLLARMGCESGQGYFYAEPLTREQAQEAVRASCRNLSLSSI